MFTAIHFVFAQRGTSFESTCEIINCILQIGLRGDLTDAKCIGGTTLKIPETERA